MFMFVYVDVIGFYRPGVIEAILAGFMWKFEITQTVLVAGVALMTIPSLVGFLSLALPARANRWTNLVVASAFVPASVFNLVGEPGGLCLRGRPLLEVALLGLLFPL